MEDRFPAPGQGSGPPAGSAVGETVSVAFFATLILALGVVLARRADGPWTYALFYAATLAVAALYVRARAGLPPSLSRAELGLSRPGADAGFYGLGAGALLYGLAMLLLWTGYYPPQTHSLHGAASWGASVPLLIGTLFQVGAEELLFRGYLARRLQRRLGTLRAVVVSSLLFGALHYPLVAGPTLYGVVLCWVFLRTGSLAAPVLAHLVLNGALSLFTLASALR